MCADDDFINNIETLKKLLSQYKAEEVLISLCVSDLWLPNISSFIKHYFAFGTFLSMGSAQFQATKTVDSYEAFKDFIEQVYSILPSFPMLEDYVPETDWGEVKVVLDGNYYRTFYGGAVERIPDFIEAFRMCYFSSSSTDQSSLPITDLAFALQVQHNILSSMDSLCDVSEANITAGHMEVPSSEFWEQYGKKRLATIPENFKGLSPCLSMKLGAFQMPKSVALFSNAILRGDFMPALLAEVNGSYFLISPRDTVEKVLMHWEGFASPEKNTLINNVAAFLSQRFRRGQSIKGPCLLGNKHRRVPVKFATAFLGKNKVYFVCLINDKDFNYLSWLDRDIKMMISNVEGEHFIMDSYGETFRLGDHFTANDVELIVILPRVTIQPLSPLPLLQDVRVRVFALPDFVTIFDSLDDIEELEKFFTFFDSQTSMCGAMSGMPDYFSAFRDSKGLLVEGAVSPTMISLDPHWGSNSRYEELKKFWARAPEIFPKDNCIAWEVESVEGNGARQLFSKSMPVLVWYVKINRCNIFFQLELDTKQLDKTNAKLLETYMHCLADQLAQQRTIIEGESLFKYKRIIVNCTANKSRLVFIDSFKPDEKGHADIINDTQFLPMSGRNEAELTLEVNLDSFQDGILQATDASFEVLCLQQWLDAICLGLGLIFKEETIPKLLRMGSRQARFAFSIEERKIDIPDSATPLVPHDSHYKIARSEMAKIFEATGSKKGRYELSEAKVIIDKAKVVARDKIHTQVRNFDKESLLVFCIEQYDALVVDFLSRSLRIDLSLSHEVSYDRSKEYAKFHSAFIKNAKNYRYLIECCLSEKVSGSVEPAEDNVLKLIAFIDWQFVLYGASDTLYNEIEVGGIELDQFLIPMVFYSESSEEREQEFGVELANYKLGLGLESKDEVNSLQEDFRNWGKLDKAFLEDTGFSFTHLIEALGILSQWQRQQGKKELFLSYTATVQEVINIIADEESGFSFVEAQKIVNFLTLNPKHIRQLIDIDTEEGDVPVWEHNKRGSRYTIKPLVPIKDKLRWGAGAAERSFRVWVGAIAEGYLPASFPWPKVTSVVRSIKKGIEKSLETKAHEVCARAAPYIIQNIDFKRRFPKEFFEDVGDFDVLAYWPEKNQWLAVECKYNQPPFCIKDARRLRERIFGRKKSKGQIAKIKGRRSFLESNFDKVRDLLGWPSSSIAQFSIEEVYVSKEIYWWMRCPPYKVTCGFVRIDALELWLQNKGFNNKE